MGQYWKLVNIDRRSELRHFGGYKLWEFVVSSSAEQLVGLLRNHHWVPLKVTDAAVMASKQKSAGSALLRLPQEIIDMIISALVDLKDPLAGLSLTCSYLFRILAPTLQESLVRDAGPWVDQRLIFVGDYASGYPSAIAGAQEKLDWDALGDNPLYRLGSNMEAEGKPARAGRPMFGRIDKFTPWGTLMDRIRVWIDEPEDRELADRMFSLLTQKAPGSTPEPVLRNLTTKQFVRDAALAASEYAYSLGEVVVVNTQWTADSSGLEGLPRHGAWAGHRFDISDMAHVDEAKWKDVSEMAVLQLTIVTQRKKKDGRRA